jgi:hypothetical protein
VTIRFTCSFAWEAGRQNNNSPTVTELITATGVPSSMLQHTNTRIFRSHFLQEII